MYRVVLVRCCILTSLIVLTSCIPISSHHGQDLSKLNDFKIERNRTTEKELVDAFGPPGNITTQADGSRMLMWTDVNGKGHVNVAAAVVPFAFGSGVETNATQQSLTATIRDGVVADYTITSGNSKY